MMTDGPQSDPGESSGAFPARAHLPRAHLPYALWALVAGAVALGFSPILVRLADVGPSAVGFWRMALPLPLFFWMAAAHRRRSGVATPVSRRDKAVLLLAGAFFAGDLALWHWSLGFTTVANSTLLANLTPIVVALGSVLLFRERLTPMFLGGLLMAIAGAALLSGTSARLGPDNLFGDGLAMCAALFYGSYILTVGRLRARHSTAHIMAWTGLVTAILLIPVSLAAGETFVPASLDGWLAVIALGFVTQALGQGLIAWALAHLAAHFSAVTLLLQPVIAAAAAWVLFGEQLGTWNIAGALIVLTGIVVARLGTARPRGNGPVAEAEKTGA